nr:helix-turn-helix domain-containing protein [Clostridia bacterium]
MKRGTDMIDLIKTLLPLSETEILLKELFQTRPDLGLDIPAMPSNIREAFLMVSEEYEQVIPEYVLDLLVEDNMIPPEFDVDFNVHCRYLPPFLHSHDYFEIVCMMNGKCTNHISSHAVDMNAGDIIIIAPGTVHAISAFTDDCIMLNLIVRRSTFDTSFLGVLSQKDILAEFFMHSLYDPRRNSYIMFRTEGFAESSPLVELFREFQQDRSYKSRMLNILTERFFIDILRHYVHTAIIPNPIMSGADDNIVPILNYIQSNYSNITISDLSGIFNYSERHISRLIKEYTGETFMELVRGMKMKHAGVMLKNPQIPIDIVAESVGYSTSSHFYRTFKNYYGVTPIEYRTQQLSEQ